MTAETQRLARLYEQKQAAQAALTEWLQHHAFTGKLSCPSDEHSPNDYRRIRLPEVRDAESDSSL